MLRFIGILTVIFLIYRWVVRPMLIEPKAQQRPTATDAGEWLRQQFHKHQQEQQQQHRQANNRHQNNSQQQQQRNNKQEGEYIDYEEVD